MQYNYCNIIINYHKILCNLHNTDFHSRLNMDSYKNTVTGDVAFKKTPPQTIGSITRGFRVIREANFISQTSVRMWRVARWVKQTQALRNPLLRRWDVFAA